MLVCGYLSSCGPAGSDNGASGSGEAARLVTLAPHLTELVFAAGAQDQLVGVVQYSDFPPAAKQIPLIGDAFRVDYERIVQLAPDVILSWGKGTPAEVSRYLRGIGFQVVELETFELDDIPRQIEQLGELAGTSTVALAAAQEVRARLSALRDEYSNRTPISVFLQISAQPWFTVTGNHILDDAIRLCGGVNIFADVDGVAPMVSFESIVEADPAVILVVIPTSGEQWRSVWEPWQEMSAVRNQRLYPVDADFVSRAGPRMIDGVAQICAALAAAREQLVD